MSVDTRLLYRSVFPRVEGDTLYITVCDTIRIYSYHEAGLQGTKTSLTPIH